MALLASSYAKTSNHTLQNDEMLTSDPNSTKASPVGLQKWMRSLWRGWVLDLPSGPCSIMIFTMWNWGAGLKDSDLKKPRMSSSCTLNGSPSFCQSDIYPFRKASSTSTTEDPTHFKEPSIKTNKSGTAAFNSRSDFILDNVQSLNYKVINSQKLLLNH